MQASQKGHHHPTDHNIVKMRNHEERIMEMNVHSEGGNKKACKSADGEEADKSQRIEHRCFEMDLCLIKSRHPIKDFDRGGNANQKTENRKERAGKERLTADEHMMAPEQKSQDR